MSSQAVHKQAVPFQREVGRYGNDTAGPLVVCIGGIHGNEPAGVGALQNILQQLQTTQPTFKGQLLALAGNVKALQQGVRYLDRDLNRMWAPERLLWLESKLLTDPKAAEDEEQKELLAIIKTELSKNFRRALFLDLHTTSSDGAPFALISDTLVNRHLALQLKTPIILGLEESIEGTILNYINELGHAAIGFEAGQHQAPQSVRNHEAAIWITLVTAGCLAATDVPEFAAQQETLRQASRGLPPVFEIRYRHAITESDQFVMNPGFTNFSSVNKHDALAIDCRGEIHASESGYLFMPLYQKLGEDGFFLVREVKPFWLKVSEWLRRIKADQLLHWLPGVSYASKDKSSLVVNTRIARWFVIEICHLLGFRKHSKDGDRLVISRRRQVPT